MKYKITMKKWSQIDTRRTAEIEADSPIEAIKQSDIYKILSEIMKVRRGWTDKDKGYILFGDGLIFT